MRKTATGGIILTTGSWVQIVCLVLLILFSAFFSASETAFTSLNKIRLKTMADNGNKKAAKAYKIGRASCRERV